MRPTMVVGGPRHRRRAPPRGALPAGRRRGAAGAAAAARTSARPAPRTVRHAPEVIGNDLKPTAALRMRDASMRVAIDAVAGGEAAGVVSAGNTGALLALAKIVIKTLPGIDRPAMAAIGPSARGDVVMLDLGANVACDARNLVEFAVMGDVFARTVLGLTAPTIGLLNVGSEELKGDDQLREAADVLRAEPSSAPQFHGFVEGHDIAAGTTDVIVTDGFTGNVALKTGEGALQADRRRCCGRCSPSLAVGAARLSAGAAGPRPAARVARPAALQRRGDARAERRGGEVARRHRRARASPTPSMSRWTWWCIASTTGCAKGWRGSARCSRRRGASGMRTRRMDLAVDTAAALAAAGCRAARRPPARAVRSILAGIGGYLPRRIVTNDELAKTVDTSDAWIRERTGIRQRHIAGAARDLRLHGDARPPARRWPTPARRPRDVDAHHPRHHARPTRRSRPPRCACRRHSASRRLRLRPVGRLQRLRLRALGRRRADPRRPGARRAGDRRRGLFAHPELAGPRHLRAVRRRRRRRASCAPARAAAPAPIAASSPRTCTPTARSATSSTSTARSAAATGPALW